MANRAWTEEECKNYFVQQENRIKGLMHPGEKYWHCLDKDSLGGGCYDPLKVITSEGRVWSLRDNYPNGDFYNYENMVNDNGYYYVATSGTASEVNPETGLPYNQLKTMTIHKLVANYFCDRTMLEIMKEINKQKNETIFDLTLNERGNYKIVQVHHINSNKRDNRAENLQYVYTEVHDILTALHNSKNIHANVREKSIEKLKYIGLENPEDAFLKDLVSNAISEGAQLYGYLVKDENALNGYRMEVKMRLDINGDSEYVPIDFEEEYIKMKIATSGKPYRVGVKKEPEIN